MAILAAATLGVAILWLWRQAAGWAVSSGAQQVVGLGATALIALCLIGEKTGVGLRLIPWDDWLFFERVPLHTGIVVLLAVCWWAARGFRRVALGTLAGVFILFALAEVAAPAFLPLVAGQLDRGPHGHGPYACEVHQSTSWSCAPAALAWALRVQGYPASELEMARLSAAMPLHGATWRGMARAAHHRGLPARVQRGATWEDLLVAPKPALADWLLNPITSHMIVILAATPGSVTVGDPLLGEITYPQAEFLDRWQKGLLVFR